MPQTIKQRVFEPFFTTKGPKRSGLGMSVSYGIIKRHRGEITVKSEEGRGTCITIKIPVVQEMGTIRETAPPLPPEEKKARILVIDDEEGVRKLLHELLETAGHDVAVASDGQEGLNLFRGRTFDMVFTDLGMPGISGWEVAKQIKELNADVVVTLITGWGIQVDEKKKKSFGVDFIISKPFNIDQVTSLVQEGIIKTHTE
jgi:CheY-like chemotaxis protein